MLGHRLFRAWEGRFDTWATIRAPRLRSAADVLDPDRVLTGVAIEEPEAVADALDRTGAEVVVNCIGVVKQAEEALQGANAIRVNALFPHELAAVCRPRSARVIQISTDCVFSGEAGAYREDSVPDARDLYGRSKLLGELTGDGCLTVRTSIIGRELVHSNGLLEWLLANGGGAVPGFTRAVFSGLTTGALADELAAVIERHPSMTGVWHVGAEPIAKHDLLVLVRDALRLDVEILPDDSVAVDRSLNSDQFRRVTGRAPPSWSEMVERLAEDRTPYDKIRRQLVAER